MQSATQSFTAPSHDAVIRVYDEAGNVIKRPSTRASSWGGERYRVKAKASCDESTTANCFGWLTALAIIHDRLRCGLAQTRGLRAPAMKDSTAARL
jgi:hypothetical protein